MKFKTIALIGFSGVGKTELAKDLTKTIPGTYHRVVTNTTRDSRDDEVNGVDYNFISEEDFKEKIEYKLLIEHAKFNNAYYGMGIDSFKQDKINIVVCEPSGIMHLYNHPKINLLNIINIEREYSLILNTIKDEKRTRQITQRRINREEEKELEKIPLAIRNQIISFENNSSNIRYSTISFNKTFNSSNIVNLYEYKLDEFINENLSVIKKNINKTKNQTIKFLLLHITKEGNKLLQGLDDAKEKNDIHYMSKVNSFMDSLEILKICHEHRRQISNIFTKVDLIEVYNKSKIIKDFEKIKEAFESHNIEKIPENRVLAFKLLEKNIKLFKSNPSKFIEKKNYRSMTKSIESLNDYFKIIKKTITNPIALNSSYIEDAAHFQYNKYKKKHFLIQIDENKMPFLENDILYKIFLNNGENLKLHAMIDGNDKFVISLNNEPLFALPINHDKLRMLNLSIDDNIVNFLSNNPHLVYQIPGKLESKKLYSDLLSNSVIDSSFNSMYIKNKDIRESVDVLLLSAFNNEQNNNRAINI